jgi:TetR/AcrR family transcriptional repressor of nem operon
MNARVNNPVGRPRNFDEDKVLEVMMDVFWRKGYDATSMSDLLRATGLHKGSIYQAFGDKRSLFLRALRGYIENMRDNMVRILRDSDRAIEGLRGVMYHHIGLGAKEDGMNSGCLALNSLVENAQRDPEVMALLKTAFKMRMKLITDAVKRAQAEGDVRSDWPPERVASLVAATEAGVVVEVKGMLDESGARSMVDDLFTVLA